MKTSLVGVVALALVGCAGLEEAWNRPILEARARERARQDAALSAEFDNYVRQYGPEKGAQMFNARHGR